MTKTKKRKLHNIQEVEETFFKGIEYLQKERYPKAIKLFERVVDFGDSPYFSGAYVNLAVAYMEQNPLDQNNLKIAKMYLKKALEIKPNNLAAKSIAVQLHVALKDFKTAINYFLDLEDSTLINGNLYFLEVMEPLAIKGDKAIIEAIPELEKLYKTYKSKWPKVINILGHAYLANQEYQKSFSAFKEYLYLYKNQPISIFTLANLSMICSTYLRNPKEGLEYAQEGLKLFKKQSQHFQTKNTNVQNILTSNLALAYSALKDYEQVVKILEPKLKTYPNNTDFHNIGFAYFKLGKYKEALENINKALFISTDETSLFVKAEIYYYQKEYEKAITYYKKALTFFESKNVNFTFKDGTGENITSINLQESETKKKIYMGLINCYIALKDFESAKAAITLALKQWPHEDEFFKIDQTINIFLDFQVSREQIENRVAELELELNNQKIKYQNKINEVRQWALKLIEIQNSTMNSKQLTIESEEDWQTIFQQIHDIALYIKNNNEDKVTYNKIKDKFCQEFKGISKEGLEFLSTGEYLYQLHKDQEIDFAPVMVEFAKVIEIELNLHLKKHKLIHKNTNLTLGQLNHQLKTFKVSTLPNITSFLDQLIRYRNGSAHTGQSTITKVEKVREMILNDGWLKLIIS